MLGPWVQRVSIRKSGCGLLLPNEIQISCRRSSSRSHNQRFHCLATGASGWHTEALGQAILGQPQRQEKLLQEISQGCTGARRRFVVVDDCDIVRISFRPPKQTRHWSLTRTLYWPARRPASFSSRLAGGTRRSSRRVAGVQHQQTCADRCAGMPRPICGPVPAARHGRSRGPSNERTFSREGLRHHHHHRGYGVVLIFERCAWG